MPILGSALYITSWKLKWIDGGQWSWRRVGCQQIIGNIKRCAKNQDLDRIKWEAIEAEEGDGGVGRRWRRRKRMEKEEGEGGERRWRFVRGCYHPPPHPNTSWDWKIMVLWFRDWGIEAADSGKMISFPARSPQSTLETTIIMPLPTPLTHFHPPPPNPHLNLAQKTQPFARLLITKNIIIIFKRREIQRMTALCAGARRLKRSFSKKSLLIFNITTTTNCPLKWTLFPDSIYTYILPIAKITSAQIESKWRPMQIGNCSNISICKLCIRADDDLLLLMYTRCFVFQKIALR